MRPTTSAPRFPNSARAAWLIQHAKRSRHRITDEEREIRLLARELSRDLRRASLAQLHLVAEALGRTPCWVDLARIEAHRPGLVGLIVLRATK